MTLPSTPKQQLFGPTKKVYVLLFSEIHKRGFFFLIFFIQCNGTRVQENGGEAVQTNLVWGRNMDLKIHLISKLYIMFI